MRKMDEEVHDAANVDVEADVEDIQMGAPSEEALKRLVNGISSGREEGESDVVKNASKSRELLKTIPGEREMKGFEELKGELEKVNVLVDDFRALAGEKSGGGRMPEKLTRRHVSVTFCHVLSPDGGDEVYVTTVGAKVVTRIIQEISISVPKKWFYTDSFPIFVANRINKFPLSLKLRKGDD